MSTTSMTISGIEFGSDRDAIRYAEAGGGMAINVDRLTLVVATAQAHRLEAAGVAFAYLFEHEMPDGRWRIMTVPVNDD
jgi:hypothetical protein